VTFPCNGVHWEQSPLNILHVDVCSSIESLRIRSNGELLDVPRIVEGSDVSFDLSSLPTGTHVIVAEDTDQLSEPVVVHIATHVPELHAVPKVRFVNPRVNYTETTRRAVEFRIDNFKMPEQGGFDVYINGELGLHNYTTSETSLMMEGWAPGYYLLAVQLIDLEGEDIGDSWLLHMTLKQNAPNEEL